MEGRFEKLIKGSRDTYHMLGGWGVNAVNVNKRQNRICMNNLGTESSKQLRLTDFGFQNTGLVTSSDGGSNSLGMEP
jgi:hypothetical protein